MIIKIYATKEDFPNVRIHHPKFLQEVKNSVRKRLELRPQDKIEIIIT